MHTRSKDRTAQSMSSSNPFGDVIFSYTRKQAIEDGVLVDLSQLSPVIRQHWKFPLACTDTVWAIIESALKKDGNDLEGILHDVSTMAKHAIRGAKQGGLIFFKVIIAHQAHELKLHIGPGDTAEPVLTLMLQNED